MDVHGNALTSPFINAALNGEVKQMLSFLTNLIPKPASRPHDTAHGPTAGVPDVPGPGSGEAGRSQRSMIIMDGYDPLCRCAQLLIGAAWAYSAPAVGLPQTPRAPCPNEKA